MSAAQLPVRDHDYLTADVTPELRDYAVATYGTHAPVATVAGGMPAAEVLARAEKRLGPLVERLGAGDPMVLAVMGCYESLLREATTGYLRERSSEDDLDVAVAIANGVA